MGLFKRGKQGIYYCRFKVAGQLYVFCLSTTNKRTALKLEQQKRNDVVRSVLLGVDSKKANTSSLSLKKALDRQYEETWSKQKDGCKPYAQIETIIGILGDVSLSSIDVDQINDLRSTLEEGRSYTTVNRYMAALKTLLNAAHRKWGVLVNVPYIPMTQEKHRIRTISDHEEELILEWFDREDPEMASFIRVLVDTGARVGELFKLKPRDVCYGGTALRFIDTKNGEDRTVPLTKRAQEVFSDWSTWSFNQDQFGRKWKRMRDHLGYNKDDHFVPHALRHTTATRMIEAGCDIAEVKAMLGHRTIITTQKYINLTHRHLTSAIGRLESRNLYHFGGATSGFSEKGRIDKPRQEVQKINSLESRPGGGTGRRKGLKIPRPYGCTGSIPVPGTT